MGYLFSWCRRTGDVLKEQIGVKNVGCKSNGTVYGLIAVGQQQKYGGSNGDGVKREHDMHSKRPSYLRVYRRFGLVKIPKNGPKTGTVI